MGKGDMERAQAVDGAAHLRELKTDVLVLRCSSEFFRALYLQRSMETIIVRHEEAETIFGLIHRDIYRDIAYSTFALQDILESFIEVAIQSGFGHEVMRHL